MMLRLFVAFILMVMLTPFTLQAAQVRIAVASNFLIPVQGLAKSFEEQTGHSVTVSAGSTGKLYAQIVNGAPFDIFLAANSREPQRLEASGLTVAGSRFTYALGKLVLWGPQTQINEQEPKTVLNNSALQRLAIANPATAPYGAAAVEVLEKLGLYDALKHKIIRGENVSQTYQYVASGAAQLGFVALSQLKAQERQQTIDNNHYWLVDATFYAPIRQQAVLLKKAEGNAAVRRFIEFLSGPAGRSAIEAYGYGVE